MPEGGSRRNCSRSSLSGATSTAATGWPPPRIVAFHPFATSGTEIVRDCGGSLKFRSDRSIVVVSPPRTVSTGYRVVRNSPVILPEPPCGWSAARAPPAHHISKKTAKSRRIMRNVLPDNAVKSESARRYRPARGRTDRGEGRSASLIEQPPGKLNLFFCNVPRLRAAHQTLLTSCPNQPWRASMGPPLLFISAKASWYQRLPG